MPREHGWAVVPENSHDLCFTDGPLTGEPIWQIYIREEDAREFCEIRFRDAKYKAVQVSIEWDE